MRGIRMDQSASGRLLIGALVLSGGLLAGCSGSNLQIDVSVYRGPLIMNPHAQIASAMGRARALRNAARRLAADYPAGSAKDASGSDTRSLLLGVATHYDELKIEELNTRYVESVRGIPAEEKVDAIWFGTVQSRQRLRELASALVIYGESADTLTSNLGAREWFSFVIGLPSERLAALIALNETSAIVSSLADSVLRSLAQLETLRTIRDEKDDTRKRDAALRVALDQFPVVVNSQSPGVLSSPLRSSLLGSRVTEVFEVYWAPINTVSIQGSGDTQYIVYKDEIGNWHIKSAKLDPSKIINAINSGVVAAVNIAATAAGMPLSLQTSPVVEQSFMQQGLRDLFGEVNEEEIASIKRNKAVIEALKANLTKLRDMKDRDGNALTDEQRREIAEEFINSAILQL
jgi:outer membrane murein-binding lipoprotein Lpp